MFPLSGTSNHSSILLNLLIFYLKFLSAFLYAGLYFGQQSRCFISMCLQFRGSQIVFVLSGNFLNTLVSFPIHWLHFPRTTLLHVLQHMNDSLPRAIHLLRSTRSTNRNRTRNNKTSSRRQAGLDVLEMGRSLFVECSSGKSKRPQHLQGTCIIPYPSCRPKDLGE